MGIENRDYMSGESSRWGGAYRSGNRSMVITLIIINVVVFVLQTLFFRWQTLESWFALNINDVLAGQIWRLTTYDFLHSTYEAVPTHLLFNMYMLYLLGRRVEEKLGSGEFLAFYLLAGIVSGIVFIGWAMLMQSGGRAIGASGATVAVLIIYAMSWPREVLLIWGIIPLPVVLLAIVGAVFDILPMLQEVGGRLPKDHVAHAAHVGGMAFAVLYYQLNWRITDLFSGWNSKTIRRSLQRRPPLRVHVPEPENKPAPRDEVPSDVAARLDRLLEKISAHGQASLSEEERTFLADASRRYRDRR